MCVYLVLLTCFVHKNSYKYILFSGGFWESPDAVKFGSGKGQSNTATSAGVRSPPKANTAIQSSTAKSVAGVQAVNSNKVNKKKIKDENESVKKLFANSISPADNFSQWCKSSLNSMKVHASIDSKYILI